MRHLGSWKGMPRCVYPPVPPCAWPVSQRLSVTLTGGRLPPLADTCRSQEIIPLIRTVTAPPEPAAANGDLAVTVCDQAREELGRPCLTRSRRTIRQA